MEPISAFEAAGVRVSYRPTGCVSTGQLAGMITDTLRLARAGGLRDLLINITAITGFETLGSAYRHWASRRWAATTAGGALRVAVVARHEHICPKKTGLLAAAEAGMCAHICETEAEAIAWLDAPSHPWRQTAGT